MSVVSPLRSVPSEGFDVRRVRRDFPIFERNPGLVFLDTAASALKFAKAKGVSYPIGVDPQLAAANAYGVTGLPQTFFLNAQHRIVDHVLGAVTSAQLAKGLRLMNSAS